jgi:hypothetical protein
VCLPCTRRSSALPFRIRRFAWASSSEAPALKPASAMPGGPATPAEEDELFLFAGRCAGAPGRGGKWERSLDADAPALCALGADVCGALGPSAHGITRRCSRRQGRQQAKFAVQLASAQMAGLRGEFGSGRLENACVSIDGRAHRLRLSRRGGCGRHTCPHTWFTDRRLGSEIGPGKRPAGDT